MMRLSAFAVRTARAIEMLSEWSGRLSAWLVLAMVLLVCYDVAMRYLFQAGSVALQELEWHLFALIFLLGAAYTLKHDGHVRVDVLYQSRWLGPRGRAWVDLLGSLLFLLPFCTLVIADSVPFVENAYVIGETSPDPGGLSHRWLLKAAIPLGFVLLALQGLALALRSAQTLFFPPGGPERR
ncbi:MAG TPA: TRAP transporter small permease subunit [Gammaproteobacteria bacterium]|nr:TRAP transporter small permease subunit [Gammaproteobacteria bacterium]